ncbi:MULTISPECIES: lysine biosynthesis protein LysW [Catellatospora]|uniref:Lysine biosynthesis protein LysW n=2 Tax=Catellatospora TaxID=53365 RepID=A0A8J3KGU2_9ACTN|nr:MULTISPECIES: lysine biosynthesis protein LysW [Catellatospora]RKE11197.1 alpha-aminoadipate carrier protein LysW [Catellatospora citrea]GIF90216.1 lysine biosynthesis protein LysW [Catellatospora chokoriensis]GIF96663.1 lysine biosynthesis protein LysW [Catellatospora citrea]
MTTMTVQACPECEGPVNVADSVRLSEILECGDCRSELEIVALNPTVLALAPEIEEDWGE